MTTKEDNRIDDKIHALKCLKTGAILLRWAVKNWASSFKRTEVCRHNKAKATTIPPLREVSKQIM